ncbi:hypothetical protein NDU88_001000 [Pleurodeles waltl]|uniref:Uncharacterized protein n=1 Tax=Pleurodeles waltl TaxID=8319 RepID=A0AAV7VY60_PLEWA|nr:hypothetical protein NDU88_001000 [Pleurodeles waltl]
MYVLQGLSLPEVETRELWAAAATEVVASHVTASDAKLIPGPNEKTVFRLPRSGARTPLMRYMLCGVRNTGPAIAAQ